MIIEANLDGIATAKGLLDDEKATLDKLLSVYNDKKTNNRKQTEYYYDKHRANNLNIAVPHHIENELDVSIGWVAKAVDMLAQRSIFDSFVIEGDKSEELEKILKANDFKLSYEMAVPSELVHSCGFWTVTKGDKYPVIRYYNALNASALWDYDKRRISAGFCITDFDYDSNGDLNASHIVLHTDKKVVEIHNLSGSWKVVKRSAHIMGRPLMEAMSFLPTSTRPFGKSRVSKSMMSITDDMQREILRMAMTSELYSMPVRAILGASEEQFLKPKEELYLDKIWLFEPDEDGNLPKLEQLKQGSMSPHIEVMRNLASRMSAEASLPVSSLGIIHDNPASAEALRASMEDLCMLAESLNKCNMRSLRNVALLCLAVSQNVSFDNLTDQEKELSVCFKNPYTPSIASQTDAMMKQASVAPWLPDTQIYWRTLGYNDEERAILWRERQKAMAEMMVRESLPSIQNANEMYSNEKPTETLEEQAIKEGTDKPESQE